MISINVINDLEKQKVKDECRNRLSSIDDRVSKQKDVLLRSLEAKEKAEQEFPSVLETIEKRITRAINSTGTRYISYTFDDTYKETFIVAMLINALPLNGFICKLSANKLDISW